MSKKQFLGFLDTPPLWTQEQFGIRQFEFPNIDTSNLVLKPVPQRIRLGHQMEEVFRQLMDASAEYDLILHNIPVKNGNRTIGEIDFILREIRTSKLLHVELTYKFYIIDPSISEPIHQLMGPNRRDMFFTKMEKVKHRQFPLLHDPNGVKVLNKNGVDSGQIEHQCCFKAQLFSHYSSKDVHIRPLNKKCLSGFWLKFDDFNTDAFRDGKYYLPFKSEWVIAPYKAVQWKNHFEILMDINLRMLKENAPMVWMRKPDGSFEKFFVVWW